MSINLRFTEQDWERIQRDWNAWWAHELDRPLVMVETADASFVYAAFSFPLDKPADEVLDYYEIYLDNKYFYGDAWPRWWPNFGPGIIAGFLGATVHCAEHTVWFSPGQTDKLEELALIYDPDNVWWRRVQEFTRLAVERWGSQVMVGHSDIGQNFDILAHLRGTQNLLYDLYDAPDLVAKRLMEITELWLRYYDELHELVKPTGRGTTPSAPIWSPGRCYLFQSDFAYMISPEMFERYVLPDLTICGAAMDHSFYHLDGKGQIPHLDLLLAQAWLDGIQWIPGAGAPPPEDWLPLLKRIRDGGKLCQLYVSPEGARTIVRELGGRGFALHITIDDPNIDNPLSKRPKLSAEEVGDLLQLLTAG